MRRILRCRLLSKQYRAVVARIARPQTSGKAERVIRTMMEMWHERQMFNNARQRHKELYRFVNFYNTVKPLGGLNGNTPFETLEAYFQPAM
ncbi:MAG: integrase core domain-containing protein [Neisseria sp.]|uniref:integrase core domain-containing protein n=1 Tax=Neisseria sp. TaxID=192066 RepID=UPI0026DAF193|nr:integrase core domain-containing protein [Neisseria sp.]MDO4249130.1 integrase core domain-containing protein [Neisseria sp.]